MRIITFEINDDPCFKYHVPQPPSLANTRSHARRRGCGEKKNIMQIESFSGLSPIVVMQDFYATLFMANLHNILIKDAQMPVDEKSSVCKYSYKINRNKSFGQLKKHIVALFTSNKPEVILKLLDSYFIKEVQPIRLGRSYPRKRKNILSKSKYKTYSNHRPAKLLT